MKILSNAQFHFFATLYMGEIKLNELKIFRIAAIYYIF